MKALGVICGKSSIGYTLLEGNAAAPVEEEELIVPGSRTARGDQLAWLLDELEQVIRRLQPDVVWMKVAGTGKFKASRERYEVEGVVQIAVHHLGLDCKTKGSEQLRVAAGVGKGAGAYKALLEEPDVEARGKKHDRSDRYLLARIALSSGG